jgi:hypothetical protein
MEVESVLPRFRCAGTKLDSSHTHLAGATTEWWKLKWTLYVCIPDTARPMPGRKFRKKNGYKKSMAYKKVFAMQKQWVVEVVKRINEWAKIEWDANEMISKNPCTTDLTNQWTNESINQWTNEPVGRWVNEPKNQWSKEPVIQWVNDSVNRCTNQWTDDSADP